MADQLRLFVNKDCGCDDDLQRFEANLSRERQIKTFDGREHIVVPVVMAKAGVEMNGAVIEENDLHPASWNGVPITVGHPQSGGAFISANSPEVLEQVAVGRIFNAEVENGKLRGEAWIDKQKVESVNADLASQVVNMEPVEVSTGYFSKSVVANDGRPRHTSIKPDHFALLQNEKGACSWEDGCGVRANGLRQRINEAVGMIVNAITGGKQEEASAMFKTMREYMLECNASRQGEFIARQRDELKLNNQSLAEKAGVKVNEVEQAVKGEASNAVLESLAKALGVKTEEVTQLGGEPEGTKDGGQPSGEGQRSTEGEGAGQEPVAAQSQGLSAEDREALKVAHEMRANKRKELIDKITANTAISREEAEKMDIGTLETVANGVQSREPDYRLQSRPATSRDADKDIISNMEAPSLFEKDDGNGKEVH